MKTLLVALVTALALGLVGCAVNTEDAGTRLAVQYGVIKVIEQSSAVTADGVLYVVDQAREAIDSDEEVAVGDVRERVVEVINFDRLSPADRLLVMSLVDMIQLELSVGVSNDIMSNDDRVMLHTLLDWVEQAALMSGGSEE